MARFFTENRHTSLVNVWACVSIFVNCVCEFVCLCVCACVIVWVFVCELLNDVWANVCVCESVAWYIGVTVLSHCQSVFHMLLHSIPVLLGMFSYTTFFQSKCDTNTQILGACWYLYCHCIWEYVFLLFGKTADMPDASIYFCRQCFPAYCPFLNAILVKCFHDSRCMNKDFHSLLEVFCCYSCVLPHPFQDCVLFSYSDLCMMLLRRDSTIS